MRVIVYLPNEKYSYTLVLPCPTFLIFHLFRSFFPGASKHLWSWIPNVSAFQEQPRPTSCTNPKGCSPESRDSQQQQQQRPPSGSTGKGAWGRLAEPYGRRERNVRGLKHLDQGPTSDHGGPYCHHSCHVW